MNEWFIIVWILAGGIALLVCEYYWFATSCEKTQQTDAYFVLMLAQRREIESLKKVNERLQKRVATLDRDAGFMQKRIVFLNNRVEELEEQKS